MTISPYGILVALGFLAAFGVTFILAKKTGSIAPAHIDRALLWVLIPGVVGARTLFVFYHLDYFFAHPQEIIAVWHGGWVFHGALVGGMVGLMLYVRLAGSPHFFVADSGARQRTSKYALLRSSSAPRTASDPAIRELKSTTELSFLSFLDLLVPGVALGQAIGRWGNYFNQEAYGLPTNLPWGIPIDPSRRMAGYETFTTFHPTFLYESLIDLGLFMILGWMLSKGGGRRMGMVFFLYLAFYSAARFGIEFLRIDPVPLIAGIRAPQLISLVLVVIGIGGLTRVLRKQKKLVY